MNNDILYYKNELNAILDFKQNFIKKYPKLTPFLSNDNKDVDVERIIESLAILISQVKQELDFNTLYIAESLINILSPYYLDDIPSLCIQEFELNNYEKNKVVIPRGSKIQPSSIKYVECNFQNIYDVYLYPLRIDNVNIDINNDFCNLKIEILITRDKLTLADLNLDNINLFLSGSAFESSTFLMFLNHHLHQISIYTTNLNENFILNSNNIEYIGFDYKNNIFNYDLSNYFSYPMLKEFFLFKEKFNFIKLSGLDCLNSSCDNKFTLQFTFNSMLPKNISLSKTLFSINACPIVNIFEKQAEPIINHNESKKYKIFIDRSNVDDYSIIKILNVYGYNSKGVNINKYYNFEQFNFFNKKNTSSYSVSSKYDSSKQQHYKEIILNSSSNNTETISIDTLCCNGNLPSKFAIGELDTLVDFKNIKTKNITIPTNIIRTKIDNDILWKIVSIISLSQETLLSKKSLIGLLNTYCDILDDENIIKIFKQSIVDVYYEPIYKIEKYVSKRGVLCVLQIDDKNFNYLGELYQICMLFSKFFSSFTPLNSFFKLKVECLSSGKNFIFDYSGHKTII